MNKAPRPQNESERVAALERYGILDTPSDAVLDSLVQATANLCEAPIALIALIDAERFWVKSCVGMQLPTLPRDHTLCNQAILQPHEILEVEDARLNEQFKDSVLVTSSLGLRFYAGCPLVTPDGHAVGTLCVVDTNPRRLTEQQRDGLHQLARTVVLLFDDRLTSRVNAIDSIIEQATLDGVMITNATLPHNPITYVNRAFELITGYSKEEVLGKSPRFLQGPDTDPATTATMAAAIAQRESCKITLKNYRKDGSEFWNDLTISPVTDTTGNIGNLVGVMRNVSDRFLAEDRSIRLSRTRQEREQARASRNRLAQIVEDSSNEIYVCDAVSFQILNANRAARNNLGYTIEESQQLFPWDFVEGMTPESVLDLVESLISGEVEYHAFESVHRRKDGSTYPASVHLQFMATQNPPVFTAIIQDISERHRQEESVRLRERAIEAVDVGVTIIDATREDNPLVYVNQTLCKMTGYTADELLGKGAGILQRDNYQQLQHLQIKAAQEKGESVQVLFKSTRKDGSEFMNDLSLSPVFSTDGQLTHYIGINRDVTLKLETEEWSQRSRKIEAVGQLAGGIAHDFNNLLSVIAGNIEFLSMGITDERHRDYLSRAESAAQMGARLTRRLLSFARQGQLEPTVLNANEHVLGAIELLRSTIGEDISLTANLSDDLWSILADASEIENTVVNLVINARDAMPQGGSITIETRNLRITEAGHDEAVGVPPGDYIRLSVSDTGSGMDDAVKARVFEPFFTTKDANSGLGLASIHGFAQQSGGDVHVHSDLDHGSVIHVYLPSYSDMIASAGEEKAPPAEHQSSVISRILVVEDNEMVRDLTVKRLHVLGYDTEQADDGPTAIRILESDPAFDLILTDIVMGGGMSGVDVARWAQAHLPQCAILLTSGYNEQTAEARDVDMDLLRVLQKPYSMTELQQRVNEALARVPSDA
ncbi:PAS domain S-box protein [Granulosicoccus sp. 3-233]|uniref:PAS domain S-box protein n=1 Tax=Granulosicoccus sp. 3-233 TaxID=3417969 RepID=UPI003D357C84